MSSISILLHGVNENLNLGYVNSFNAFKTTVSLLSGQAFIKNMKLLQN